MFSQTAINPARKLNRTERRLAKKRDKKKPQLQPAALAPPPDLEKARRVEKSGQTEIALELYSQLFHRYRDNGAAQFYAARFFDNHQRSSFAYQGFKRAVEICPNNSNYWQGFGTHLVRAGHKEAAVIAFQRVCALVPGDADLTLALANAHMLNDDPAQALSTADAALALRPDFPLVHFKRGVYLSALGRFEESHKAFYKALDLNPEMYAAYYRLALLGPQADKIEKMLTQLKQKISQVPPDSEDKSLLLFAIAMFEERLKNYDQAFAYYIQANAAVFDRSTDNMSIVTEVFSRCRQAYRQETFNILSKAGLESDLPVFIIGMPRSGTSLVEQIISSHSKANGAGELVKMSTLTQELANAGDKNCVFPLNIETLNPEGLQQMGEDYLNYLHRQSPGDWQRITDKMPFNFENLGLIKILFPRAAILHCKRNPLDTCISCFATHFGESDKMPFAYDLAALGRFYQEYDKLMAHWNRVLPGQILDVQYEEMIEAPEAVSRQIIEHIGLAWEPACLDFHNNKRDVKTASLWQVRQPIFKTSAGRWRKYEKHLSPLQKALAEE